MTLWEEGVQNSLCLFIGTPWDGVSSLDFIGVLNRLLRASNLAFLAVCGSQSESSELPLMTPLAFSDLALAHLGGTLLILGWSGVEVLLTCALHWSLFAARAFCWVSSLSLLSHVVLCVNGIMHGSVNYCHFREWRVQGPYCKVARLWWWWSWSFPAAWFTVCIVIRKYFTLGRYAGTEIRLVIVTRKYFTLGGCCGPGMRTAVTGLLLVRFSFCLVWSFLRHVSIAVSQVFTRTGTCSCFREYFSLGGCTGLGSYNIFVYCTAVIVIREYVTLWGCIGVRMSNAICGGIVTPLSLELAQCHCWEGLFSMMVFSKAHNSIGVCKSGSPALMVHLGGCGLVLLAGVVLTLVTWSLANLICFLGLMALFSGTNVSEI